ncbi:MAG: hypothetical protein CMC68_08415, partial [Flavobacteriaceae bacterium]|nr:hypothetical protein [Flavobacteriaceae bacterium]
ILSLLFSYLGFTQETKQDFYKRSFIAHEGCENPEDLERCYEISFHEFLAKHINRKALKDSIFFKAKKDTITVSASILYDENGKVVKRHSRISNPASNRIEGLEYLLDSIPTVKPVLDKKNNGVALNIRKLFGFYLNKAKDTIVPIFGYTPSEVPYKIIEKVPVYRGCDESMSNEGLKKCMNDKVVQLISENFRTNLATKHNLKPGIQRIYVMFKIDKKGRVKDIVARGPHPEIEKEAIRVIKKIPRLKKPGYQRGKPVIVPFSIPIVFAVSD